MWQPCGQWPVASRAYVQACCVLQLAAANDEAGRKIEEEQKESKRERERERDCLDFESAERPASHARQLGDKLFHPAFREHMTKHQAQPCHVVSQTSMPKNNRHRRATYPRTECCLPDTVKSIASHLQAAVPRAAKAAGSQDHQQQTLQASGLCSEWPTSRTGCSRGVEGERAREGQAG